MSWIEWRPHGGRAESCAHQPWCSTSLVSGTRRSPASRRDTAAYVRRARCRWSAAVSRWADIGSTLPVPVEVRTGEDAVLPIALLPHRDVRDDFLLLDQPAEELARPIGCVRGEPPRPQIEALFYSIQHRLCRGNFIVGASRRCLDMYDYCILDVHEVDQPISELHALVGLGCPGRLLVRRRDHLGRLALITALSFALGSTALI